MSWRFLDRGGKKVYLSYRSIYLDLKESRRKDSGDLFQRAKKNT